MENKKNSMGSKMFLIDSLTQHRKFAVPFLLPVCRVCMKIMVIACFRSSCTQYFRLNLLLNNTGKRSSRRLIWVVQPPWTPKNNRITGCSNFNWFENLLHQTNLC